MTRAILALIGTVLAFAVCRAETIVTREIGEWAKPYALACGTPRPNGSVIWTRADGHGQCVSVVCQADAPLWDDEAHACVALPKAKARGR